MIEGPHEMVEDKKLMANMFIEHFTAKVNNLLGDYRPQNCQVLPGPLPKLKLNEIKNAFSKLSNKKSCGMDNIPGFFLKCFSNILAPCGKTHFIMQKINICFKIP